MYTNGNEKLAHRSLQDRLGASFPRNSPPDGWEIVTPPVPTLEELKIRKRSEINSDRQQAINDGFNHGGIPVQTRTQDRENLQGLVTAAQLDSQGVFTFRDADNALHQLTAPEVIAMGIASMEHVQTQYVKSWQLKDQIDAATTPEELDLIQW